MAAPLKRILVIGDKAKPRVPAAVRRALLILRRCARVVAVDLTGSRPLDHLDADLALVFGGDGAILKAVRRLGSNLVPVCGVNLGKLGFLATLTDHALDSDLRRLLRGPVDLLPAMRLACSVRRAGRVIHRSLALNDAVVSRGSLSRIVPIELRIDRSRVTIYNGDGLIVSTPLGSTAHSLSAGGPIIQPGVDAVILTPICPHTLSNRPLVIPAAQRIDLAIGEGPPGIALTVDGQVFQQLRTGDEITVTDSGCPFPLVMAAGRNYFTTLREKLGWSGHFGA